MREKEIMLAQAKAAGLECAVMDLIALDLGAIPGDREPSELTYRAMESLASRLGVQSEDISEAFLGAYFGTRRVQ